MQVHHPDAGLPAHKVVALRAGSAEVTVEAEIIHRIHAAPRGHYATRLLPGRVDGRGVYTSSPSMLHAPATERPWISSAMLLHAYGTVYPLRRGDSKHRRYGAPYCSCLVSRRTADDGARAAGRYRGTGNMD